MLSDDEINRIAVAVAKELRLVSEGALSMEEASRYLGLKASKKSLAAVFSRMSSARRHKYPLKCHYVGRQRTYYKRDLDEFAKHKGRN